MQMVDNGNLFDHNVALSVGGVDASVAANTVQTALGVAAPSAGGRRPVPTWEAKGQNKKGGAGGGGASKGKGKGKKGKLPGAGRGAGGTVSPAPSSVTSVKGPGKGAQTPESVQTTEQDPSEETPWQAGEKRLNAIMKERKEALAYATALQSDDLGKSLVPKLEETAEAYNKLYAELSKLLEDGVNDHQGFKEVYEKMEKTSSDSAKLKESAKTCEAAAKRRRKSAGQTGDATEE